MPRSSFLLPGLLLACLLFVAPVARAGTWSVTDPGQGPVDLPAGTTGANDLSGIAWVGGDQWLAIGDKDGAAFPVTIVLDAAGRIGSATLGTRLPLAGAVDAEGIAWDGLRGTLFVADESGPSLREFSRGDGSILQTVGLPSVFSHVRPNLSLESLSLDPVSRSTWTANEEALDVDGFVSGFVEGTLVRLQRFDDSYAPSGQWALRTDPIEANYGNPGRDVETSGVSDLVALPGDGLLVLERSAGGTGLRSRLYLADFTGASDTSALAALAGAAFEPVGKSLRWSRNFLFQNFEGAALGPELPGGGRSLVLVSDDGGGLQQSLYALVVHEGSCGDGFVDPPEESCDDGNHVDGDGCTAACVLETCGDGVLNDRGREECEDGNLVAGDGCGPDCRLEKPARACRDAIRKAAADHAKQRRKALARCRDQLNRGAVLVDAGSPPMALSNPSQCADESGAATAIARAAGKLRSAVAGGATPRCHDALLPVIGACAATVDGLVAPDGRSGCLVASNDGAIDSMIDDEYGRLLDAAETDLRKCQETIAKFAGKLAETGEKSVLDCRKKLLAGRPLFFDSARTQPLFDPLACDAEADAAAKIRSAAVALRSKAVALGGCDDAKVAALAQACSTTLDGLATTGGDAGCLVSGHAAGVAALLAARP